MATEIIIDRDNGYFGAVNRQPDRNAHASLITQHRDATLNSLRWIGETLSIGGNLPLNCTARLARMSGDRIDRPTDPANEWFRASVWRETSDGIETFCLNIAGGDALCIARTIHNDLCWARTWERATEIMRAAGCPEMPSAA